MEKSREKYPSDLSVSNLLRSDVKWPNSRFQNWHSTEELRLRMEAKFLIDQVNKINGRNIKVNTLKKDGYKKDIFGKYVINDGTLPGGKGKKMQMFKVFSTEGFFTLDKENRYQIPQVKFFRVSRALPKFENHYLDSFSKSDEEQIPTVVRPRSWWLMKEFVDKDGIVYHFGEEAPELEGTLHPTKSKYPNRDALNFMPQDKAFKIYAQYMK